MPCSHLKNSSLLHIGGSKAVLLRPVSDQELSEDEDHPQLMQRLTDLREVRTELISVTFFCCYSYSYALYYCDLF